MNEKIVDYCIVTVQGILELDTDVKTRMKAGWQPFGSPFSLVRSSYNFAQAMVKYEIKTYEPVSTDRRIEPNL